MQIIHEDRSLAFDFSGWIVLVSLIVSDVER